ncbi:MAG TPA: glucose 1-dehydrogenase [Pseudonocardia sp.]|uniref:SDR family NAD(P)-dependent oxidoreductase n=1 Tax=Pseudonocardia sp. TaxID=60912 RepID=UPI002B83E224|nr:glucose 1-dehydrogenase [Pseudonocardia sp.]HTF54733.1 glucose 1-dehydrogenase [Pseudonocardia sp.]
MSDRLRGKVAIVSGAARGMGAATCRRFVEQGARVLVTDVVEEEGELLAKELGASAAFARLDVAREADWTRVVEDATARFGKVDVLVNNAGVLRAVPLPNMTEEIYREVIDVNQIGVFLGMKAVVGAMVAAGGGSIVNISSIDGHQGTPTLVAYVAAKYAVRGMTRVAALELARAGIRVNTVCPGATRTRMMDCPDMAGIDIEGLSARMAPLGRIGEAHEIADAALFLASDESSYITGTDIVVDGGAISGVGVEMFSQVPS